MRLKVNEAIARSEMNGKKVLKKDIADRLFPGVNPSTKQVNMTNLINGTTRRVKVDWVIILCEMLDCDANFLFGIQPRKDEK